MAGVPTAVAFVLKGYPRLSETFIAQEIRALERRGLDIRLFSLRRPTDHTVHPVHREIVAPVVYLPEYLYEEPLRVLRAWRTVRRLAGYAAALATWRRDLRRQPTANRARRFGQAAVLAAELPADVGHLHAHFLHTPASVTRYAATMLGLPWSVSAHAKDVWTIPDWEAREKLGDCRWLASCSRINAQHLAALAADAGRVRLIYHGIDLARFQPAAPTPDGPRPPARNGDDPRDPVRLLSVGRAVEKKGYDILIEALRQLPGDLHWRLVHIGAGERLAALKQLAASVGLASRIDWLGALPQGDVLAALRRSDLFVLAARVARDGDRDGLPNVLLEAQSQGLACLSTRVSAIPELIEHDRTGLLVPPGEPQPLAAALARLIRDPALRARLGQAGLSRVSTTFAMAPGIEQLAALFGLEGTPV
ncbi:MAG: glycosyltransferase [Rhodospirillales bacterium]|nr:glycosyltransferase [Rhodospirillales bacterium]